jgi:hypothetical protein
LRMHIDIDAVLDKRIHQRGKVREPCRRRNGTNGITIASTKLEDVVRSPFGWSAVGHESAPGEAAGHLHIKGHRVVI